MSIATDYFKKQSGVLNSQYQASLQHHKGDTGSNREGIVANWLVQHLPRSTSPEIGGQIIDSAGHVTEQIDIVVYNDNAPRFGGNPKSYYFAEGVIAAIQVKSKLTSGELTSAINNLETVKQCELEKFIGLSMGEPPDSIFTGIFAFELATNDFSSVQSLIKALKRRENQGKKSVDFVCINNKTYIVHNKGIWRSKNDTGEKLPLPSGYIEVDNSEAGIFRMVLALSSEAKRNIATGIDFQPYFLEGWN